MTDEAPQKLVASVCRPTSTLLRLRMPSTAEERVAGAAGRQPALSSGGQAAARRGSAAVVVEQRPSPGVSRSLAQHQFYLLGMIDLAAAACYAQQKL